MRQRTMPVDLVSFMMYSCRSLGCLAYSDKATSQPPTLGGQLEAEYPKSGF